MEFNVESSQDLIVLWDGDYRKSKAIHPKVGGYVVGGIENVPGGYREWLISIGEHIETNKNMDIWLGDDETGVLELKEEWECSRNMFNKSGKCIIHYKHFKHLQKSI